MLIPFDTCEQMIAERRTRFEVIDQIRSNLSDVSPDEIENDVVRTIEALRSGSAEDWS